MMLRTSDSTLAVCVGFKSNTDLLISLFSRSPSQYYKERPHDQLPPTYSRSSQLQNRSVVCIHSRPRFHIRIQTYSALLFGSHLFSQSFHFFPILKSGRPVCI
ncbi:hypothetical protein CPB84DRAFT_187310 [Gymnopilus junonius]|uniref:Uncharacterized protein n=1 Tax=Gymnopilus junonius TaxID=109634 RepID=A0A9P5TJE5_GYMJU|nr:hypothetical protein CPB84DRAFT_187310 [Gymnopilus junonius]